MAKRRRAHGEGTIYREEDRNRWVGQVWLDGRRRKVTGKTKTDVAAKLGRLQHGDPIVRQVDQRVTVARLLADWQSKALAGKNLAPSTRETHAWCVRLLTAELGKVRVTVLDATMVEEALTHLGTRAEPLSRASLIKIRSTLRQALTWAERRRLVAYNAAAAAELPTVTGGGRPARRALTVPELNALLEVLDGHPLAPMFLTMARVGLRPGEAAGLCIDALDLDGDPPTIAIIRGVQLHAGRPRLVDDLKTAGARRTLAIGDDVTKALRLHLELTGIDDGLLFPASDGGPLWPSTARGALVDACDEAGINRCTPNELRHTAATHLADAGLPPHHVADILGHRTTRMVDATYRHRPAVIRGADFPLD